MFFIGFPIFSYPIWPHTTTSIGYTKPYAKPSQSHLLSRYMQIIIPYGYLNTLISLPAIFHLPTFAHNHLNNLHQKHFLYLSYLSNSYCIKKPLSIVRTDTLSISSFFLELWTMTTRLRILDSWTFRFKNVAYFR